MGRLLEVKVCSPESPAHSRAGQHAVLKSARATECGGIERREDERKADIVSTITIL